MDMKNLENEFWEAKKTSDYSKHQNFIKDLLSSNENEVMEYHYKLIADRENRDLYLRLRAAFKKRGNSAENFLIGKINVETNPKLQGDILHILGSMYSNRALPLARAFIKHQDSEHRYISCYVLGWIGIESDINLLNDRLLNDPDPRVRETAATAHDQIMIRIPEAKNDLLKSLKQGLEIEKEENVQAWIIITIQYILKKKFGLKENIGEANWQGNLEKAKSRALDELKSV